MKARLLPVMAVLLLVGIALVTSSAQKPQEPKVREFHVIARQWEYEPSVIKVNQGDTVIIRLRSADVSHGFYIEGYDIGTAIINKEGWPNEKVLKFKADKPGVFTFRCNVTCGPYHPFMTGKLIVQPNNPERGASLFALILGIAVTGYYVARR